MLVANAYVTTFPCHRCAEDREVSDAEPNSGHVRKSLQRKESCEFLIVTNLLGQERCPFVVAAETANYALV